VRFTIDFHVGLRLRVIPKRGGQGIDQIAEYRKCTLKRELKFGN